MKLLLIFGSMAAPLLMSFSRKAWPKSRPAFNLLAIIAALVFGNIASLAIYEIIQDNMVFMTNIHGILLNPFFLLTGAYLGVYLVYRLIVWTFEEI
ncbi:transposase [Mesobacillus harenae]|uniref:transposase n=1 Tax=Mesobacillus harenae TaxID=2213203 RepID=UPI0015812909|nr:transposase [Mesobacillus harenae]